MKNSISLLMFILLISLSVHSQTAPANSANVEDVIHERTQMMVQKINDGDHKSFASFFAEDATMKLTGTEAFTGREAIAEAHRPMTENGMQIEIESDEIFYNEDFVTETGSYKIFTADGEQVDYGDFMTLWKNIDGNWQIYRDVISSSGK
ncbi:nuclear transport factor 2 family protein [Salegentibacter sp. JZCK2]|uniref:YybH family protein n=1 Tax=Salegentibacter tibetensis TaxID=2873600 RepID=UPI001CCA0757|nr:nuclear transport factor 2 family protein [Salegentibacter tibetensis]MBZ9730332.1 nuclear transport factor 2 family protein [Salegentibacter tibetensis]